MLRASDILHRQIHFGFHLMPLIPQKFARCQKSISYCTFKRTSIHRSIIFHLFVSVACGTDVRGLRVSRRRQKPNYANDVLRDIESHISVEQHMNGSGGKRRARVIWQHAKNGGKVATSCAPRSTLSFLAPKVTIICFPSLCRTIMAAFETVRRRPSRTRSRCL